MPYRVRWDNGKHNSYMEDQLDLLGTDSTATLKLINDTFQGLQEGVPRTDNNRVILEVLVRLGVAYPRGCRFYIGNASRYTYLRDKWQRVHGLAE